MAGEPDAVSDTTSRAVDPELPIGESRWPPALALLAFMAINIALRVWLPNDSPVRVAVARPRDRGRPARVLLARAGDSSPRAGAGCVESP